MKNGRRKKGVLAVLVCIILLGAVYAGLYGWIQWQACVKAQAVWSNFPEAGDPVEALILRMQSANCPLKHRNEAVWVVGRLADERALPALQKAYTGGPCNHDAYLCQYELKKAITRYGGRAHTPDTPPQH